MACQCGGNCQQGPNCGCQGGNVCQCKSPSPPMPHWINGGPTTTSLTIQQLTKQTISQYLLAEQHRSTINGLMTAVQKALDTFYPGNVVNDTGLSFHGGLAGSKATGTIGLEGITPEISATVDFAWLVEVSWLWEFGQSGQPIQG
jgi:hypothetical protein